LPGIQFRPGLNHPNRTLEFPRGYHIEIGGGYGLPGVGAYHGAARANGYGAGIGFAGSGETIPNIHS
jgi:hypothetical protein